MKQIMIIVILLSAVAAVCGADPEAELRQVEKLFSTGKVREGRKFLLSIHVPTNRVDLAFKQCELDLQSLAGSFNIPQMIREQPDQDAPRTWAYRLWYAHGQMSAGKTNEAYEIYRNFTNRFAQTPGVTNTHFWTWAAHSCQAIEKNKKLKVQQAESTVPSKAAPSASSDFR